MNGTSGSRALVACVLLAAAACGDPGDEPRRGGTVVIAAGTDLDHANPLVSADQWTSELLRFALFTPLVQYDEDLGLEPVLAESWAMAGDTAVTFHLRRDIRWHDGTPTTAYDVQFTFDRAKNPETGFPNAAYFSRWTRSEVVDSYTVRFTMERHAEPLAGWPFTPIVPRHLLDTVPVGAMRQAAFNRHPVGNGPFRFVSQRTNDRWVFERNPDYPEALGGPALVDRVVWRVIPENAAQIAELRAGEADLVLQPRPEQVVELAEREGFRAVVKPSRQFLFIAWNGQRGVLADARVRRALSMGIDREAIVQAFREGYGQVVHGPVMPTHWAYDQDLEPVPFSPDSARVLLAEAGLEDRDRDGVLENEAGEPFRIELKVAAGSDYYRDMAEAIRDDLAALGVDVRTRATEFNTLAADVTSPERRFDAFLLGWAGDFRLDLEDLFHSGSRGQPYQFASYANPELDSLMHRASAEPDRAEALPMWHRVQEILRDDQPWTIIFYQRDALLLRDRLKGVDMDIRGVLLSLPEWWVSEGAPADSVAMGGQGATDGE